MRRLPETIKCCGFTPYGYSIVVNAWEGVAFNGESRDPLGLGHRVYSCPLMRFFSADGLSPFFKGGINTYAYCGGDPVNFSDPDGAMRRATNKVAPRTLGKNKVTWGDENPLNPSLISGRSSYGARTPQKSILKVKSIGDTKIDKAPPAEPIDYDVPLMAENEVNELRILRAAWVEKRSKYEWNSVGYRAADAEVKRIRRLMRIDKGIRQDQGRLELTKLAFSQYPEEPEVDYE